MGSLRALAEAFATGHPDDAARLLEPLDPDAVAAFVADLPVETGAALLRSMVPVPAGDCLARLGEARAAELLGALPPLDARAILARLTLDRRQVLLARLAGTPSSGFGRLAVYPDEVAGAWVDTRVPAVVESSTAGDALAMLSRLPSYEGGVVWLLAGDHHPRGYLTVSQVLKAAAGTTLASLDRMTAPILSTRSTLASIATHEGWRRHESLPVVDRQRRFVGVLGHRVLARLADSTSSRSGPPGTGSALSSLVGAYWNGLSTVLESVLQRGENRLIQAREQRHER